MAEGSLITLHQQTKYDVSHASDGYVSLLMFLYDSETMLQIYSSRSEKLEAIELIVGAWFIRHGAKAIISNPTGNTICDIPIPNQKYITMLITQDIVHALEHSGTSQKKHIKHASNSPNIIISCRACIPSVLHNKAYMSCLSYVESNVQSLTLSEVSFSINCWIVRVCARCSVELEAVPYMEGIAMSTCTDRSINQSLVLSVLAQHVMDDIRRSYRVQSIRRAGCKHSVSFNNVELSLNKNAKHLWKLAGLRQCTRLASSNIAKSICNSSRSKNKIQYTDGKRHCLGDPPKLTIIPALLSQRPLPCNIEPSVIAFRLRQLEELEAIHNVLICSNLVSQRDKWEEWIDNFKHLDAECDAAFMCLITIMMSSSTSDSLLANIMPRLFCSGLTSARGVVEVAERFGVDSICSLLSESGRFYQNTERILNAADYFVQKHKGRIPIDISVQELCSLLGVGYKTANIVVTTAFRRIEGIPSDIHVIRWSVLLGWITNHSMNGLECSKAIEQWLPKSYWGSINPLFGAFGQLLSSSASERVLDIVQTVGSGNAILLFRRAKEEYTRQKNNSKKK